MKDMPGQQAGRVPVMRLFGVNDAGNSVCCHVHGFSPYFYVTCPSVFKDTHLADFKVTQGCTSPHMLLSPLSLLL